MKELNALDSGCSAIFGNLKQFKGINSESKVIYGITSILRLSISEIPDKIKREMPEIFKNLLDFIEKYEKSLQEEKKEEGKGEINCLDGNDEVDDYDDYDEDSDEDYDDVYDDELMMKESDLNMYKGPMDLKPAPLFFKEVFGGLQELNCEMYNELVQLISSEKQVSLEAIFAECEQRR